MAGSDGRGQIILIGTGGSISTLGRNGLDLLEYGDFGRIVEPDELARLYPEINEHADLVVFPFRAVPSPALTAVDWLQLNDLVHQAIEAHPAAKGVVITHGTATLEETAYFLNLTLRTDKPVVLVGAQRPPTALSSDSGLNLVNAIRVASSPDAVGRGVLAVLNDEIHSARSVTKTNTYRLHSFRSPVFGPLGVADPDRIEFHRAPDRAHCPDTPFDVRGVADLPRVDIAYSHAGSDGLAIRAFANVGAAAVVLAAVAPGKPTPLEEQAIRDVIRAGVIVVNSCRAGEGRVVSVARTRELGVVVADDLNPQKARVLAMLAVRLSKDRAQLEEWFATY